MQQHIGAPCQPIVLKGDEVKVGQVIGDSEAYVSAPIHSSVSGKVLSVGPMPYPGGGSVIAVEIESDGLQTIHESVVPHTFNDKKEFLALVRASGLVGLGGAGFPGHVKLNPQNQIMTLVVNAAECEPYITSDYRAILENAENIIEGIKLVKEVLEIDDVCLGIEDNKPEAAKYFDDLVANDPELRVTVLPSVYPQGAEKMLIYACTGKKVPPGKLPADVGTVVLNVNSLALIAEYIHTGMPLVSKTVTVSGSAVKKPMNLKVPIGTPLSELFDFCEGFSSEPRKVLMGGPMMGIAQHSLDVPVIKNTNAVLAFDEAEATMLPETSCIRCGKCVENCPMHLMPLILNMAAVKNDLERLESFHIMDCVECGTCVYNCPAKRRIVQSVRLGKSALRSAKAKEGK